MEKEVIEFIKNAMNQASNILNNNIIIDEFNMTGLVKRKWCIEEDEHEELDEI